MNQICRDIFRAIHEGKWLKIEYRNRADQVTKYWIGIRDLDPRSRTMKVDGPHLGQLTIGEYDRIFRPEEEGAAPPAGAGIPVRYGTDPGAPCKAGAAGGRP